MKRRITASEYREWIIDEIARASIEGHKKIEKSTIFVKNSMEVSNA